MSISDVFKTNKELFGVWNCTQAIYFKKCMEKIKIDFLVAGSLFSHMADELGRIPTFEEFEKSYVEKDN